MISLVACTTSAPSFTLTAFPSVTVRPSATITPSPSSTPTPTQTITQKRVGECPTEQEGLVPDFKKAFEETDNRDLVTPVLNFLNQGGSQQAVVQVFKQSNWRTFEGDLTADNVPELGVFEPFLSVLGCINGKYEVLLDAQIEIWGWSEIVSTQDINRNGVPELVVHNPDACGIIGRCSEAYIYEWNGQQFKNIVETDYSGIISMRGPFDVEVKDIDENGTQELLTSGGIPNMAAYADGIPWRTQFDTYMWNGKAFVLARTEFEPPEYRFQAVQDGDRATLRGDYERALAYYEQTMFDEKLEWWTPERQAYEEAKFAFPLVPTPTPLPVPIPDPRERPHLTAYAQYRIMLLYIRRGMWAEAQTTYDTLQKNFREDQSGYIYAKLATTFWMEYQATSDIGQSCNKAIQFATARPTETLSYLGDTTRSHYHGWQSIEYQPKDICPFSS
jgi:hypothetical protein